MQGDWASIPAISDAMATSPHVHASINYSREQKPLYTLEHALGKLILMKLIPQSPIQVAKHLPVLFHLHPSGDYVTIAC